RFSTITWAWLLAMVAVPWCGASRRGLLPGPGAGRRLADPFCFLATSFGHRLSWCMAFARRAGARPR
ncbi:MAG TPA: hypothetical protein DCM14_00440, partial [Clostridiales bacterium UBA8153]|nr:hypothetical protein [Clostridiales bacterium UBA8153]